VRASRASCRRKSVIFVCLFFLFVTLWSNEVCDNGNAMKQCNFQNIMVSLHRERFVVVFLYSTFSVDPQNFALGQIYTKISIFSRFWGLQVHILKPQQLNLA